METERVAILVFAGLLIGAALAVAVMAINATRVRRRIKLLTEDVPSWEADPKYPRWRVK